jgi:predicted O-methyltransferase YrrM
MITYCLYPCRCSFDLIFLDANKDGYAGYYSVVMEQQLLAHNGLLVVDNSLMKVWQSAEYFEEVNS